MLKWWKQGLSLATQSWGTRFSDKAISMMTFRDGRLYQDLPERQALIPRKPIFFVAGNKK